jgi:hypothetical protein
MLSKGSRSGLSTKKRLGFESLEARVVMSAASIVPAPGEAVVPTVVAAPPDAEPIVSQVASFLSTEEWVQSLAEIQLPQLAPQYIPMLSAAQVSSLSNVYYFRAWSSVSRAALQEWQVKLLNINSLGLTSLTSAQTSWLTPGQIGQVNWQELQLLEPRQLASVTASQLSMLDAHHYRMWSATAKSSLQEWQVKSLNLHRLTVQELAPSQVAWLAPAQIQQVRWQELYLLLPRQIQYVTASQLRAFDQVGYFRAWSGESRAALLSWQVRELNISLLGLQDLLPSQIEWLTPVQLQQVSWQELHRLLPRQIPYLKASQLQSIGTMGHFQAWTPESRAALLPWQVQQLNVSVLGIGDLPEAQVSWLLPAQIQSIEMIAQYARLNPSQIPLLSTQQISKIPSGAFILDQSEEFQQALTREQLFALSPQVWAEYSRDVIPPASAMTSGPVTANPHAMAEEQRVLALVPRQRATHVAIGSGLWTDASIWQGGQVPTQGARVLIPQGTTVTFNAFMTHHVSTLRIDGTLTFGVHRNTQLKADTIVVDATGRLLVGTESNPIRDNVTARILIADSGPINRAWDPYMLSRGVISLGQVQMYGKNVTGYAEVVGNLAAGTTVLNLRTTPMGWNVGDRIVISGANARANDSGAEERTILAINGNVVTIEALRMAHAAPQGYGASIHVANLTRNIELVAEDPSVVAERPHLMLMHNPQASLQNIGVYGFGRTDKSLPINDPIVINGVLQPGTGTNPRARYAVHFHHTGVDAATDPALIKGSVVVGSPGWGFVNHSSYVVMENNVAFGVHGASFVGEDGNEIGVMRGNLSVSSVGTFGGVADRAEIHDFGFEGHGFWLQGPGILLEGNVSAGSRGAGYVLFMSSAKTLFNAANLTDPSLAGGKAAVPVGSVPLKGFVNNVAYGAKTGLDVWKHMQVMNDSSSEIVGFLSWNTWSVGIDVNYSGRLRIRNATLLGDLDGYASEFGIRTNFLTQGITIEEGRIVGFKVGIQTPVRRETKIVRGFISAIVGINVGKGEAAGRQMTITGTFFGVVPRSVLQDRTQMRLRLDAPYDFAPRPARRIDSLFAADFLIYAPAFGGRFQLYANEQAPQFVPFTTANALGYVPTNQLGLTNSQLKSLLGITLRGGMTPATAVAVPGVYGGVGVPM